MLELKPEDIGEHYGRYRLHVPDAERAMAKSLERYGNCLRWWCAAARAAMRWSMGSNVSALCDA